MKLHREPQRKTKRTTEKTPLKDSAAGVPVALFFKLCGSLCNLILEMRNYFHFNHSKSLSDYFTHASYLKAQSYLSL